MDALMVSRRPSRCDTVLWERVMQLAESRDREWIPRNVSIGHHISVTEGSGRKKPVWWCHLKNCTLSVLVFFRIILWYLRLSKKKLIFFTTLNSINTKWIQNNISRYISRKYLKICIKNILIILLHYKMWYW